MLRVLKALEMTPMGLGEAQLHAVGNSDGVGSGFGATARDIV